MAASQQHKVDNQALATLSFKKYNESFYYYLYYLVEWKNTASLVCNSLKLQIKSNQKSIYCSNKRNKKQGWTKICVWQAMEPGEAGL